MCSMYAHAHTFTTRKILMLLLLFVFAVKFFQSNKNIKKSIHFSNWEYDVLFPLAKIHSSHCFQNFIPRLKFTEMEFNSSNVHSYIYISIVWMQENIFAKINGIIKKQPTTLWNHSKWMAFQNNDIKINVKCINSWHTICLFCLLLLSIFSPLENKVIYRLHSNPICVINVN